MNRNRVRSLLLVSPIAVVLLARIGVLGAYPGDVYTSGPSSAGPSIERSDGSGPQPYSVASRTGAAQYSYPIVVPPGRRGMQPSLSLDYSSQAPLRGGIAAGWTMSIPSIRVDTSSGRLGGVSYLSTLAGGARLVEVYEPNTAVGAIAYRAQSDDSFTRYQHVLGSTPTSPGHWIAHTADGQTYTFGDKDLARDVPVAGTDAVGARWFVTKIADRLGNEIEFRYTKPGGYAHSGRISIPMDISLTEILY